MKPQNRLLLTAALCASATPALAQSAWLPGAGEWQASPGFSFSTFDEFWAGRTKVSNPGPPPLPSGESLNQYTGYVSVEYGILGNLAADLTVGYTFTDSDAFGGNADDDGLTDTLIGLRYKLVDETKCDCPWMPTVTWRVGGIIAGTYDENLPFSAGDGAHGLETSLLFGKSIGETGFGLYGDIGYRFREGSVPEDLFGAVGVYKSLGPVTLVFGYRHTQGLSGLDIEGPGFDDSNPNTGFPAVKEIVQLLEGGIAYTDKGGRNYQFSVAGSVDGRNTGDKLIFGFNVTIPFGGR
jgi:hypothetical protein